MEPTDPVVPGPTVAQAIRQTALALSDGGIESPTRDARRLVEGAAALADVELILQSERILDDTQQRRLAGMIARRMRHEPVARILGERDFYGRTFRVTADTLDPRPETETLIEAVLEIAGKEGGRDRALRLIDVGTGTGCILITLLAALPNATGLATDVSPAALAVAEHNARRAGVLARMRLELKRSLEPPCDTFDILVSNPPYIESGQIGGLAPDVRDYDPIAALDGGPDGLDIYREITVRLSLVVPKGWAFFEVGARQAHDVARMLEKATRARHPAQVWRDLGGHDRCVAISLHR